MDTQFLMAGASSQGRRLLLSQHQQTEYVHCDKHAVPQGLHAFFALSSMT